jgi:hypothetical protein
MLKNIILVVLGVFLIGGVIVFEKSFRAKSTDDVVKNVASNVQNIDNTKTATTTEVKIKTNNNTEVKLASNEIKIEGKIEDVKNGLPYDGNLVVTVLGKNIILQGGGLAATPEDMTGQMIGFDQNIPFENYLGSRVEVFAKKVEGSDALFTILGSKYYIKLIK